VKGSLEGIENLSLDQGWYLAGHGSCG
jgi:hypothetical protein